MKPLQMETTNHFYCSPRKRRHEDPAFFIKRQLTTIEEEKEDKKEEGQTTNLAINFEAAPPCGCVQFLGRHRVPTWKLKQQHELLHPTLPFHLTVKKKQPGPLQRSIVISAPTDSMQLNKRQISTDRSQLKGRHRIPTWKLLQETSKL